MNEQWTAHLIEEYSDGLFRFLSMHTECKEDAEDLMQDVFANCYKARDNFDSSRCSEQAWVFVLAKNRLKNYYRDKKNNISLDSFEYEKKDPVDYMSQAIHTMRCREIAAEVIKTLDERAKKIIILRFFEEKSHEEIGSILGLSTGNVRVIQGRALKKMEEYLKKNYRDIKDIL
ncbi:MAG: sigma-70 family RNA polymerase sigma factor [Firmicutes bacterium]|nr:sigma-70 family RNA polymerase sigma factor [Bacillota bacterium]